VRVVAAGAALVIAGLILLVGLLHGTTETSGGEVAVVRNGGPLDNHRIRQTIEPAEDPDYEDAFLRLMDRARERAAALDSER
jgi:hypothetical protein